MSLSTWEFIDSHVAEPRSTVDAVALPGSRMPAPDQIDRTVVRLHDRADLSRPLVSSG